METLPAISLPVALAVTFLLLLVLYLLPGLGRNQPSPILCQAMGVAGVGAVYSWWAVTNGVDPRPFWFFFLAGGLPSLVGLALDKLERHWLSYDGLRHMRIDGTQERK